MPRMQYRKIRFFTKGALVMANAEAIARGAKQALDPAVVSAVPDGTVVSVYQYHPIGVGLSRVVLVMNAEGDVALLDVPTTTVEGLPIVQVLVPDA